MENGTPLVDALKALLGFWFFLVLLYLSIRIFRGKQFYKDSNKKCQRGIFTGLFSDENAFYNECCTDLQNLCNKISQV
jgi:hypothetical protein